MTDPAARPRALALARAAWEGKALDIALLQIGDLTTLADYFLICGGTSDRHVRAIADRLAEAGREAGLAVLHREGVNEGRWALIDFGEVVAHVFDEPTREYYKLEELWADAPRVELALEPAP